MERNDNSPETKSKVMEDFVINDRIQNGIHEETMKYKKTQKDSSKNSGINLMNRRDTLPKRLKL